jgi:serine/threonine protein kinase
MGEVYRAKDNRLERDVALKVLREDLSQPERLARFQREARLLAALNHPNIATIYGLDNSNGTHFLVMEWVPGDPSPSASSERERSRWTKPWPSPARSPKRSKQPTTSRSFIAI